jgi:outer membrane protein
MKTARHGGHPTAAAVTMALLFAVSAATRADEVAGDDGGKSATSGLSGSLGLGLGYAAAYPGSDTNKSRVLPLVKLEYGRFFIGGEDAGAPGIGFRFVDTTSWKAGIVYAHDLTTPRKESDSARLDGMGDIGKTNRVGLFASYQYRDFTLGSRLVRSGDDQGTRIDIFGKTRFDTGSGLRLTAGPTATWANREYNQTYFGVDADQSARSGLAQYHPSSGLTSVAMEFGASYPLGHDWLFGSRLTLGRLMGDAAQSPLTEQSRLVSVSFFSLYHF